MNEVPVVEYKYKNANIRVIGEPNMPRIEKAAERFVRQMLDREERNRKTNTNPT